jgi:hypothetical protein
LFEQDEAELFPLTVRLFTLLLQSREEPVMTEFMFSGVDALLMERFPLSSHFLQEQILYAFLAISGGSRQATQAVFERFILRYPPSLFQHNERNSSIIIRIAANTLSLGPAVMDGLASNGVLNLALEMQTTGTFPSHEAAVFFFSNLCVMVEDPRIEVFLIEHRIVYILVEFLSFSTQKSWKDAVNGITQVKNHIDGNPFQHPLFEGVDADALYATFCDMYDRPGIEAYNKGLYVNIGNWLELLDERGEDFVDQDQ